jgi:hypothetical protein
VDDAIEIRARPITIIVMPLAAIFFAYVVLAPIAIIAGPGHFAFVWVPIVGGLLLGTALALRLRARFDVAGISVRNAFRSRRFAWPEITEIRVIPSPWYCCEPGWAAAMPEVTTSRGEHFPLRVCTHLKRAHVDQLSKLLDARAAEYRFDVPKSLIKLWKMDARPNDYSVDAVARQGLGERKDSSGQHCP